jgi:hypothetical protein
MFLLFDGLAKVLGTKILSAATQESLHENEVKTEKSRGKR